MAAQHGQRPALRDVHGPRSQKKFMRKTVVYTITSHSNNLSQIAHRRYRDFVALHDALVLRFPGAFVPPLPPTRTLGKTGKAFVERRRVGLEAFLQALSRNPFLRCDTTFGEFLSSKDMYNRRLASQKSLKSMTESEGALRWKQAIAESESPANAGKTLYDAVRELEAIGRNLRTMETHVKSHIARAEQYAASCADLGVSFSRWMTFEDKEVPLLSGSMTFLADSAADTPADALAAPATPRDSKLSSLTVPGMLRQSVWMSTRHVEVMREHPQHLETALALPLRYEIMYVDGLLAAARKSRSSIVRHRKAMTAYRSCKEKSGIGGGSSTRSVGSAQFATALPEGAAGAGEAATAAVAHPAQPGSPTPKKVRAKLGTAREAALAAQREAKVTVRGTLVLELGRFRCERTARLSSMLHTYASVYLDNADKAHDVWTDAVTNFPKRIPATAELQMLGSDAVLERGPHASSPERALQARLAASSGAAAAGHGRSFSVDENPEALMDRLRDSLRTGVPVDEVGVDSAPAVTKPPEGQPRTGSIGKRRSSLRALYEFKAENSDEVSVREGEVMEGELDSEDPNWYVVTTKAGGKGLVPANYVEVLHRDAEDDDADADDDDDEADWDGRDDSIALRRASDKPQPAIVMSQAPKRPMDSENDGPPSSRPPPIPTAPKPVFDHLPKPSSVMDAQGHAAAAEVPKEVSNPAPARANLLASIQGFDKSKLGGATSNGTSAKDKSKSASGKSSGSGSGGSMRGLNPFARRR